MPAPGGMSAVPAADERHVALGGMAGRRNDSRAARGACHERDTPCGLCDRSNSRRSRTVSCVTGRTAHGARVHPVHRWQGRPGESTGVVVRGVQIQRPQGAQGPEGSHDVGQLAVRQTGVPTTAQTHTVRLVGESQPDAANPGSAPQGPPQPVLATHHLATLPIQGQRLDGRTQGEGVQIDLTKGRTD
jgi:hypothetical protein